MIFLISRVLRRTGFQPCCNGLMKIGAEFFHRFTLGRTPRQSWNFGPETSFFRFVNNCANNHIEKIAFTKPEGNSDPKLTLHHVQMEAAVDGGAVFAQEGLR